MIQHCENRHPPTWTTLSKRFPGIGRHPFKCVADFDYDFDSDDEWEEEEEGDECGSDEDDDEEDRKLTNALCREEEAEGAEEDWLETDGFVPAADSKGITAMNMLGNYSSPMYRLVCITNI